MKTVTILKKEYASPKKKPIPDIITQLERSLDDIENGRVINARDL